MMESEKKEMDAEEDGAPELALALERVWVVDNAKHDPRVRQVVSVSADGRFTTVVEDAASGQVRSVPSASTFAYDASHGEDLDNVADMNNLHEPALLSVLQRRYAADSIYTRSGDVVISVNPYKNVQQGASGRSGAGFLQHLAARTLEEGAGSQQAILVNGESGAGKTEATKMLMQHLCRQAGAQTGDAVTTAGNAAGAGAPAVLLAANPLLEAFGNARTVRNDNSSRFGKFVRLHFAASGELAWAETRHFLLEQSRLVTHATGERNFHVFYQLCSHRGEDPGSFALLRPSAPDDADSQNKAGPRASNADTDTSTGADKEGAAATLGALEALGVSAEEAESVFGVLHGILLVGNVEFAEQDGHASLTSDPAAASAALALGMAAADLSATLLSRTIGGRDSVISIPLSKAEAEHSRNGLVKAVYSRLFDWLVNKVNAASAAAGTTSGPSSGPSSGSKGKSVGLLDIFGFEILQHNSFEQLCVNYANEVLQKLFNEHMFELECQRYAVEGVSTEFLTLSNNEALLAVLDGTFAALEEQARLGAQGSDDKFLAHAAHKHAGSGLLSKGRFGSAFQVTHFAGAVDYAVRGFVAKNNDSLQGDLADLLQCKAHGNAFVSRQLFPAPEAPEAPEAPDSEASQRLGEEDDEGQSPRRARRMAGLQTVSSRFREEMGSLVGTLESCGLYFVRCIKPNEEKAPSKWNSALVLNQLRHLGIMEAVRIRQEGFPVTRTFRQLDKEFSELFARLPDDLDDLGGLGGYSGLGDSADPDADCGGADAGSGDGEMEVADVADAKDAALADFAGVTVAQLRRRCAAFMRATLPEHARQGESWQLGNKQNVFMTKDTLAHLEASKQRHVEGVRALERQLQALAAERARALEERAKERQRALEQAAVELAEARAEAETKKAEAEAKAAEEEKDMAEATERERQQKQAEEERQEAQRRKLHDDAQAEAEALAQELQLAEEAEREQQAQLRDERRAASTRLQSWWRAQVTARAFASVLAARRPWRGALRPGEGVLLSSFVVHVTPREMLKKVGLDTSWLRLKKRRGLVLTTGQTPRLLVLDPKTSKVLLERDVSPETTWVKVLDVQGKAFSVTMDRGANEDEEEAVSAGVGEEQWSFVDILGAAAPWAAALMRPRAVADFLASSEGRSGARFESTEPVQRQGLLRKRAVRSRKNWRQRWFVLQGSQLMWFKAQKQATPSGAVRLSPRAVLTHSAEDRTIVLTTPELPLGLHIQTASDRDTKQWLAAISAAILNAPSESEQTALPTNEEI